MIGFWRFNDNVEPTTHIKGSGTYDIIFKSNETTFNTLKDDIADGYIYYDSVKVYTNYTWNNINYKNIEILDVSKLLTNDEVNPAYPTYNNRDVFTKWLKANATKTSIENGHDEENAGGSGTPGKD